MTRLSVTEKWSKVLSRLKKPAEKNSAGAPNPFLARFCRFISTEFNEIVNLQNSNPVHPSTTQKPPPLPSPTAPPCSSPYVQASGAIEDDVPLLTH
jgi:hypothetical protein